MKAPKCKICGAYHYGLCPVGTDKGGTDQAIEPVPDLPKAVETRIDTKVSEEKKPFDRNAYQKQYMKKYITQYMREYRKRQKLTPK